jgi:hypothetical protein
MSLTKFLSEESGIFTDIVDLQASEPLLKSVVTLIGDTSIQFYRVGVSDLGGGLSLANGRFANPIESPQAEANKEAIEWEFKTGGGLLEENHNYILGDSLGYTMPVMGDASKFVGLSAHGGNTPTMTVNNVTAAEHFIKAIDLVDNGDLTFQIDESDNGKDYTAISNATDWEM